MKKEGRSYVMEVEFVKKMANETGKGPVFIGQAR